MLYSSLISSRTRNNRLLPEMWAFSFIRWTTRCPIWCVLLKCALINMDNSIKLNYQLFLHMYNSFAVKLAESLQSSSLKKYCSDVTSWIFVWRNLSLLTATQHVVIAYIILKKALISLHKTTPWNATMRYCRSPQMLFFVLRDSQTIVTFHKHC